MAALILIDLQVDFLSSTPDRPARIDARPFISLLPGVLREFTSRRRPIIWVRSAYATSPPNTSCAFPAPDNTSQTSETIESEESEEQSKFESYLTQTHGAGRFCRRGTPGAAIHPRLAEFKQDHHIEVMKTWYSSFTDTNLDQALKETDTTDIFIAGVTTNTCVAATTVHALRLGYKVTLLSDLTAAIKPELHNKAISTLTAAPYSVTVSTAATFSTQLSNHYRSTKTGNEQPLPTLYWVRGSIPSWRVMLSLSHLKIPYISKRLRVMSTPKETRSEEFKRINPRCKTPVLVDNDGIIVTESMAILQYLDRFYCTPDSDISSSSSDNEGEDVKREEHGNIGQDITGGKQKDKKDKKDRWTKTMIRFHESEIPHSLYEPIELLYRPDWEQHHHKEEILKAYGDILKELNNWEGYLSKGDDFLSFGGQKFGMADCAFYPVLAYFVHRGLVLNRRFPNLGCYFERCAALREVQEACPDGWERPGRSLFGKCEMLIVEGRNAE